MKTRTWKIGEYAKGGIIRVTIRENNIYIDVINDSTGNRICGTQIYNDGMNALRSIQSYLWDITTPYYEDKITTWIKANIKFVDYEDLF